MYISSVINLPLIFPFPLSRCTSHICPPSHPLAEAVPGTEEDYPCISRRSVIRNQSKGPACGVGMVRVLFENKPTRSSKFVYGGWHFLQINDVSDLGVI